MPWLRKLRRWLRTKKGLLAIGSVIFVCTVLIIGVAGNEQEVNQTQAEYAESVLAQEIEILDSDDYYFGLSAEGVLTIYQGPPDDDHVIQTFFRIDTERLKARMSADEVASLQKGIQVHDMEEYKSVLATYNQFSTEY